MGDPRKHRRKYSKPGHPWQKGRIDRENRLAEEYGLKNKKELWRHDNMLKQFKEQTKELIRRSDAQAEKEKKQLLTKLDKYNLVPKDSKLEHVLEIKLENLLDRRLQTMLVKKGMARTMTQARQFVVHGHIIVNGKVIDIPSYLLNAEEESQIQFDQKSPLADTDHPERQSKNKEMSAKKAADEEETKEEVTEQKEEPGEKKE